MRCEHCQATDGDIREYEWRKILPGWPGVGTAFVGDDGSTRTRHFCPQCQRDLYKTEYRYWSECDQSLNDCRWFVRDGKTQYGWYDRMGERYGELLWQAHGEAGGLPPGFAAWLEERGLRQSWWEPRDGEFVFAEFKA